MLRRFITLILCLPAVGALVHWLLEHPGRSHAPTIAAATFGGLAVLIVLFTVILPAGMMRRDEAKRAEQWRRAAAAGLPPAVFFTFAWSFLFLPQLRGSEYVVLGVAGVISLGLAVWWERCATRDRARPRTNA